MSKSEPFTLSSTIPSIEYNDDNAIYINVDRTNRIQFNFDMINADDKITIEWGTSVTG